MALTLTPWTPVLETLTTYKMWEPSNTEYNLDSEIARATGLHQGFLPGELQPLPKQANGHQLLILTQPSRHN